MPLKINLKPFEKIIINQAVISNGPERTELVIHNPAHILRKKDILLEEDLNCLSKKIYFVVQLMYLFPQNLAHHQTDFNVLMQEFNKAYPDSHALLVSIQDDVAHDQHYHALQKCKKLIANEVGRSDDAPQQYSAESLQRQHEHGGESPLN